MRVSTDLCVASIERSVAFYRDALGFTVTEVPGPDGKLAHAEASCESGAIMFDRLDWLSEEARANLGNGISLYVNVGDLDIDALYGRVRSLGATITQEIANQFWGDRHFQISDPDGYRLSFAKTIRQVSPQEMMETRSAPESVAI